jgi:hypothetical protein
MIELSILTQGVLAFRNWIHLKWILMWSNAATNLYSNVYIENVIFFILVKMGLIFLVQKKLNKKF